MKCECCTKNVEDCFYDGNISYCFECVSTKKIDENIHESEKVEWEFCQHCKNIIRMEDFIGNCDMILSCKDRVNKGYSHLCKDCGKKYDSYDHKTLTSCILCTIFLKKINN